MAGRRSWVPSRTHALSHYEYAWFLCFQLTITLSNTGLPIIGSSGGGYEFIVWPFWHSTSNVQCHTLQLLIIGQLSTPNIAELLGSSQAQHLRLPFCLCSSPLNLLLRVSHPPDPHPLPFYLYLFTSLDGITFSHLHTLCFDASYPSVWISLDSWSLFVLNKPSISTSNLKQFQKWLYPCLSLDY